MEGEVRGKLDEALGQKLEDFRNGAANSAKMDALVTGTSSPEQDDPWHVAEVLDHRVLLIL